MSIATPPSFGCGPRPRAVPPPDLPAVACVGARLAGGADVDCWIALQQAAHAEAGFALDVAWARDCFFNLLRHRREGAAWLLLHEGAASGYLLLSHRHRLDGAWEALLREAYLEPALRRGGVATAGLTQVAAALRASGCEALALDAGGLAVLSPRGEGAARIPGARERDEVASLSAAHERVGDAWASAIRTVQISQSLSSTPRALAGAPLTVEPPASQEWRQVPEAAR